MLGCWWGIRKWLMKSSSSCEQQNSFQVSYKAASRDWENQWWLNYGTIITPHVLQREQYALSGGSLSTLAHFASFLLYEFQAKLRPTRRLYFHRDTNNWQLQWRHKHALIHAHLWSCIMFFIPHLIRNTWNISASALNCIPAEKNQNKSNLAGKRETRKRRGRGPMWGVLTCTIYLALITKQNKTLFHK